MRSHTDNLSYLLTIGDMNNPLGSMHGYKRGTSRCPLNIAGSSFDTFSVAFKQYKYILVSARLISGSLSTDNVTTSIILSIIYNCERKRYYNGEILYLKQ